MSAAVETTTADQIEALFARDVHDILNDQEALAFINSLLPGDRERVRARLIKEGARAPAVDGALRDAQRAARVAATAVEEPPTERVLAGIDKSSPLGRIFAAGLTQRSSIFEAESIGTLSGAWLDSLADVHAVLDQWRAAGVANIKEIKDTISKRAEELRAAREVAQFEESGRPVVWARNPDVHVFVDQVEGHMLEHMPDQVFVRSGELVRLRQIEDGDPESDPAGDVVVAPGMTVLHGVTTDWLALETSRAGFLYLVREDGYPVQVRPPEHNLRLLLTAPEDRRFPRLRGLSMVPTLSRSTPGYDPSGQLYLAFPEGLFPVGPENPTKADAEAALRRLSSPLREFRFKSEADRSVILSAFLAAVVRPEMRSCPLHAISAPMRGSGKSKIVTCAGWLALGNEPTHSSFGLHDDENEKRLTTILLGGSPVISLNNVPRGVPLDGSFLCQMLTENPLESRLLGEHKKIILNTTTLVLANGNLLEVRGDMVRRCVMATIDIEDNDPTQAVHTFDPVDEVKANRPQLVVDCLTIVRAWIAAGRPLPDGYRKMASFEDYDLVRGPLLWLGQADPAETQKALFQNDEEYLKRAEVLQALFARFGSTPFYSREVVDDEFLGSDEQMDAHKVLREVVVSYSGYSSQAAGRLLRGFVDQPASDLVLRSDIDKHKQTIVWRVERVGGEGSEDFKEDEGL